MVANDLTNRVAQCDDVALVENLYGNLPQGIKELVELRRRKVIRHAN
jgi:hypothetical protein